MNTVKVPSGVSWLHDKLMAILQEREEFLKEAMGTGLPYHEYIGFVGRRKECVRHQSEIAEIFTEFYQADEEDDDE